MVKTRPFRSLIILLVFALLPLSSFAAAQSVAASPTVNLDGVAMQFDVPPKIVSGSTMVPMRAIFEALGSSITWDSPTKSVKAVRLQTEFNYKIGNKHAWINGRTVEFSGTPGFIEQTRTLVPLRMVSESFGATVSFDPKTKKITINSNRKIWPIDMPETSMDDYRVTLPYQRQMEKAPYFVRYMEKQHKADSLLFFGDSTTWGSYLGRLEALPYLVEKATGRQSFNLGVPGFTATHMVPFMEYALQHVDEPDVVVELQYFWGQSAPNSGLDLILNSTELPSYESALSFMRQDFGADDERFTPSYANYTEQTADTIAGRVERGKQLFFPKASLDPELNNRLEEMKAWIAGRPNQTYYLYIPPYQLGEAYRKTNLTPQAYSAYIDLINQVFADLPNVRFRDFNQSNAALAQSDFIDWIHRSKKGEEKFAAMMATWLQENK